MILLWLPFHAATQNSREIYNGYTHSHSPFRQTADAINYTGKKFGFSSSYCLFRFGVTIFSKKEPKLEIKNLVRHKKNGNSREQHTEDSSSRSTHIYYDKMAFSSNFQPCVNC